MPGTHDRAANLDRLISYFRPQLIEGGPDRYTLVMLGSGGEPGAPDSEAQMSHFSALENALEAAGREILDAGLLPYAIYNLDSGESIELHVSTPVVTISEDQGMMVNPLRPGERVAAA